MLFDMNIIFFIVILLLFIVIGYILHNRSMLSRNKKNRDLRVECDNLKKSLDVMGKENDIYSNKNITNNTSYISSNLKAQEGLQLEIDKLKKTVEDTKRIAQDASMIKNEFLTNIRHEIRTPMNSILVFAQLIETDCEDKRLGTFANNIVQSGNNLLNLFNNILELAAIESGSFEIKHDAVNIRKFMNVIVSSYKNQANKKNLFLKIEIDKNIPESIMIDYVRVKEILNNLIDNAIKFTEYGSVKVTLALEAFDAVNHEVNVNFRIQDTGIGIIKNNQEKIFKIFENRESTKDIKYQGTGLGLSINRKLAELMNGNLQVQSEITKGSEFTLTLNNVEIVLDNNAQVIDESKIDFSVIKDGSSIIVIDNDKATLDMIEKCFVDTKVETLTYFNVSDAMDALKSKNIDMLIINVDILTMDDGAVSKVINSISRAMIVTLVSSRLVDINFHKAGVQPVSHLKKPLQKLELFRVALKVLNTQDIVLESDGSIEINGVLGLSFTGDKSLVEKFFRVEYNNLEKHLNIIIMRKDLSEISQFGETLENISLKYKMNKLNEFAQELKENVDNFDIDAINDMLNEYKNKSEQFKQFMDR